MRALRRLLFALICVPGLLALDGCSAPDPAREDPVLLQLERVARHLTGPRHLRASAFPALRTSDRPSELVSFLFSDIGVAEWPPADDSSELSREQMNATNTPMFPAGGALVFEQPDPRMGRQLVLSADDRSGEIVATAYLDPGRPPVYTQRWPMPEFREPPGGR